MQEPGFRLQLSSYDEETKSQRDKILLVYKWQDRSRLRKPCDVQKHDSDPLHLLLRGGHCRGGWGAVPSWATQQGLPSPLSLLHLGQTVVPGSTKAAPMRAPRFSVCLQRRLHTLVEFSQNPVPCRARGRQRLMVLAHWGALVLWLHCVSITNQSCHRFLLLCGL